MKNVVASLTTREYALNTLAKLTTRFSEETQETLTRLISTYKTSIHLELQQRSCEYGQLTGNKHKPIRSNVLGRMPIPKNVKKKTTEEKSDTSIRSIGQSPTPGDRRGSPKSNERKVVDVTEKALKTNGVREDEQDNEVEEEEEPVKPVEKVKPKKQPKTTEKEKEPQKSEPPPKQESSGIFDLDIFGPGPSSPTKTTTTAPPTTQPSNIVSDLDLLGDIFSGTGIQQSQFTLPVNKSSSTLSPTQTHPTPSNPIPSFLPQTNNPSSSPFDALDFSAPTPQPQPIPSHPSIFRNSFPSMPPTSNSGGIEKLAPVVVFQEAPLTLTFQSDRKMGNASYLRVTAIFNNTSNSEFTDFDFQVAVPMFVELNMEPPSGRTLTAQSPIYQSLTLIHKEPDNPKKKLKIRVKMAYKVNGAPAEHTSQIGKFF